MRRRPLGPTGIEVSELAFGCGPVSGLMTGADGELQRATIRTALECGINWFDTAAGYGAGRSEENLGRALRELGAMPQVHIATKVRLSDDDLFDIRTAVRRSLHDSLMRLGVSRVTLLQLHNSITVHRGDEPTSITPEDVLGEFVSAGREAQSAGLVRHLGLTGIGQPEALKRAMRSGEFATIQVPYHLLNPSAGQVMPPDFAETNYGNIMEECERHGVAVLAIRVFAGGALLDAEPSAHTRTTPFFPLGLYERDRQRAKALGAGSRERALQFVLNDPRVTTAIVGFGSPGQVRECVAARPVS